MLVSATLTLFEETKTYCLSLHSWRRLAAAFSVGALCCLALPPLGWFPVLWLGLPVLLWLLQGTERWRQAFLTGWFFGFGYFLIGLYWIAAALFVDLSRFGWMVPFVATGLPILFGFYYGAASALWRILPWRGLRSAIGLAWLFGAVEYTRGFLFTGFPWNLFGYTWANWLPIAQSASLFGLYGLTLLTLIAAILPAALATPNRRLAIIANGMAMILFVAFGLWGAARLQRNPTNYVPDVYVRLVQPAVTQTMKWNPSAREDNFSLLLELTAQPSSQPITHVIWPETAVTYFLAAELPRRLRIAAILPPKAILLTGAPRENEASDLFNSLLAIDKGGNVIGAYDKAHLVPFGEYVPFRSFGPIAAAAAGLGSFTPGPGPRSLRVPGLPPFSPLICYEVIFPHHVADRTDRPGLLVNITNDAWYGRTAGPYQHLAIARMRAIEEGVPLLRVANTGISAIVDSYGRTIRALPLGTRGIIDSPVPIAIGMTWAAHYGEALAIILWLTLGLALLNFGKRKQ